MKEMSMSALLSAGLMVGAHDAFAKNNNPLRTK